MYYTLHYALSENYMEKRAAYRALHFSYISPYFDNGQLLMGGAYDDTSQGALLIFKVDDRTKIEDFAKNDPYVINRVVVSWRINQWNVAIGND